MPSEPQSAAAAFDALRAEVGETRADLRKLARRIADTQAPNYDLTLGEMAKRLEALQYDLGSVRKVMPPARLPHEMCPAHGLTKLIEQSHAAARELRTATGGAMQRKTFRGWVAASLALGTVAGVALCLVIAASIPRVAGTWMAAAIVGGDPWIAGQNMMRQADPEHFGRMVRLYQACPQATSVELCRAAMAVKAAAALEHDRFSSGHTLRA